MGASPQIDVGGATVGVALRQEAAARQGEQKEGGGATSGVALLNS